MTTHSNIFQTIQKLLVQHQVTYQTFEHEPVYTMEQAARVCSHNPQQGVKTLLAKLYDTTTSQYYLVVWQGNERIPFDSLCDQLKYKKWRLANPQEVLNELGISIGALSPFGYLKKYHTIFDRKLLHERRVYISAGTHNVTIALDPKDLINFIKNSSNSLTMI